MAMILIDIIEVTNDDIVFVEVEEDSAQINDVVTVEVMELDTADRE